MAATIVDIRAPQDLGSLSTMIASLRSDIVSGLLQPNHQRTLPQKLLYDERGLRLYNDITTRAPEYYVASAEEQILKDHASHIASLMMHRRGHQVDADANSRTVVIDLGAGALRKTSHVLLALARSVNSSQPPISYYALDPEKRELARTLDKLYKTIGDQIRGKVEANGMWGTFEDGFSFIKNSGLTQKLPEEEPYITRGRVSSFRHKYIPQCITPNTVVPSPVGERAHSPLSQSSSQLSPVTGFSLSEGNFTGTTTSSSPPESPRILPVADDHGSKHQPLHLTLLGTTLGNFSREDASEFLNSLPLRPGSGDTLLLGLDHRNDVSTIEAAYNDGLGFTREFVLNGLRGAERILKGLTEESSLDLDYGDSFRKDGWEYLGRWNEAGGRHDRYYRSTRKQNVIIPPDTDRPHQATREIPFEEGELIHIECSNKFSEHELYGMFEYSNLRPVFRWKDNTERYSVWLLERPPVSFPLIPSLSSSPAVLRSPYTTVPTLAEWSEIWTIWDTITVGMIPPSMLHQKPIDLRHKCLFYVGHIPTFLDIQMGKVLKGGEGQPEKAGGATEPINYREIFERGIDPHVDDPTQIHPHSEVPEADEDWPTVEALFSYRDRVRARLVRVYEEFGYSLEGRPEVRTFDRGLGRALWMAWEHEGWHVETLLWMLIQKAGEIDGTIPPSGFIPPSWSAFSELKAWNTCPSVSETVDIGPATVSIGHDDFDEDDTVSSEPVNDHEFGWDNESPRRDYTVGRIKVEKRPISNAEFYEYWKGKNMDLPALWVLTDNGDVQVRTLYGPAPLSVAQNWPFIGTYDAISAYAKSKGGRMPTHAELTLFRDLYEGSENTNVGFRNWHPIPPQEAVNGKRGHNGGVWEWTSTIFDTYEGFKPSWLYPGFSNDFFDGAHHVVLGGSYASLPRQALRRSVVNWFQHNYPYGWIGGRVVYDV